VTLRPLREVLEPVDDFVTVSPDATYPMMGVRSFGRGAFAAADLHGAATQYPRFRCVTENMLVYPKLMAWEGAFAIVPESLSGRFVSPEFVTFRVHDAAPRYVHHLVSWEGFRERFGGAATGTNARRRRLSPDRLLALRVPVPDQREQQRIADHLDAVEATTAQARSTSVSTETFYRHLVDRLVDQVSIGADTRRLGEIVRLRRDQVAVTDDEEYEEIGLRSFGKGIFVKAPVSGASIGSKRVFHVRPGDLVVSNVFGWEGAVAVAQPTHRGLIGSHRFMTWEPRDVTQVFTGYLSYYLVSETGLGLLRRASPGSAGRNRTLSITNFEAIRVPLPSPETQRSMVSLLDRARSAMTLSIRRESLSNALIPAARNEVFNAML